MENKYYFTKEQIAEFELNPYVSKASATTITYTENFREEFYARYSMGEGPTEILRSMGFDTQLLGKDRIKSIAKRIKKMSKRDDGFKDTRKERSGRPTIEKEYSLEEMNVYLLHQLKYKDQQIEALKKINLLNKKEQWNQRKKDIKSSKK